MKVYLCLWLLPMRIERTRGISGRIPIWSKSLSELNIIKMTLSVLKKIPVSEPTNTKLLRLLSCSWSGKATNLFKVRFSMLKVRLSYILRTPNVRVLSQVWRTTPHLAQHWRCNDTVNIFHLLTCYILSFCDILSSRVPGADETKCSPVWGYDLVWN